MEGVLWPAALALAASLPGIVALVIGYRRAVAQQRDARRAALARDDLLSQLQEQVAAQQKTIRFLTTRVDSLEAARAQEYAETETLREETESLRQEVRELRRGVQELTKQIEAAGLTPVWRPPEPAARVARRNDREPDTTTIRELLAKQFSLDEIDDLAFRLKVEPEELSGTTKGARARSLVNYLKARKRLDELIALCRQERPDGGF